MTASRGAHQRRPSSRLAAVVHLGDHAVIAALTSAAFHRGDAIVCLKVDRLRLWRSPASPFIEACRATARGTTRRRGQPARASVPITGRVFIVGDIHQSRGIHRFRLFIEAPRRRSFPAA